MSSYIRQAERVLERRYGTDARERIPNFGKIRNRLEPHIYERRSAWKLWSSVILSSVAASILAKIAFWVALR